MTIPTTDLPGVYIKTFGCQLNEYDSERIYGMLQGRFRSVRELSAAKVVIINTCSVRAKAEKKLYDVLGWLEKHKQAGGYVIGVCGCVAQQEGERILRRWKGVDFVVGTHNLSLIPGLVENALAGYPPTAAVNLRDEWEVLPESEQGEPLSSYIDFDNAASFGAFYAPMRAFVAIQRGCNKNCSYCVVPRTRGRETSRALDEVIRETRRKVEQGAREVFLLGQTVNSYGRDLPGRIRFEDLVRAVADIPGVRRIRFASPHPQDVSEEFILLYRDVPTLCPQIHLPLQSGSDRILALMNRNYRVKRYLEVVERLRAVRADIAISSDFIVGFPTETAEDFEQTLAIMRQVNYSFSYSFKYSPRPDTDALFRHKEADLIGREVADERLTRLQELQTQLCLEFNNGFIGQSVGVIIEGPMRKKEGCFRGRTPQNVLVEIALQAGCEVLKTGDEVAVKIEQASPYGLKGVVI